MNDNNPTVQVAIASGVATLTLNRPDRLNSLTDVVHAGLREALSRVRAAATSSSWR